METSSWETLLLVLGGYLTYQAYIGLMDDAQEAPKRENLKEP